MAKPHRGKGIRSLVKHGRDTCPVCKRTAVKVLHEVKIKDQTVKVCKICKAALANGTVAKEVDVPAAAPAPETVPAG